MLDVHIALVQSTPPEWHRQCLRSVCEAAAAAPFRVNVHVFDGPMGHIGRVRAQGYGMGSAPWMAYVDDDDYVLPNAFACLAPAMAMNPAVIFTREIRDQNGHQYPVDIRHHMAVYRRDIMAGFDYEAHPLMVDVKTAEYASRHGAEDVMEHVYVHRLRLNSPSRLLKRELHKAEHHG